MKNRKLILLPLVSALLVACGGGDGGSSSGESSSTAISSANSTTQSRTISPPNSTITASTTTEASTSSKKVEAGSSTALTLPPTTVENKVVSSTQTEQSKLVKSEQTTETAVTTEKIASTENTVATDSDKTVTIVKEPAADKDSLEKTVEAEKTPAVESIASDKATTKDTQVDNNNGSESVITDPTPAQAVVDQDLPQANSEQTVDQPVESEEKQEEVPVVNLEPSKPVDTKAVEKQSPQDSSTTTVVAPESKVEVSQPEAAVANPSSEVSSPTKPTTESSDTDSLVAETPITENKATNESKPATPKVESKPSSETKEPAQGNTPKVEKEELAVETAQIQSQPQSQQESQPTVSQQDKTASQPAPLEKSAVTEKEAAANSVSEANEVAVSPLLKDAGLNSVVEVEETTLQPTPISSEPAPEPISEPEEVNKPLVVPEPTTVNFETTGMNISNPDYTKFEYVESHYKTIDAKNYANELKNFAKLDHSLRYYKGYSSFATDKDLRTNLFRIIRGDNTANLNASIFFAEATNYNQDKIAAVLLPSAEKQQRLINPKTHTDYNKYDIFMTGLTNVFLGEGIVKSHSGTAEAEVGFTPTAVNLNSGKEGFTGKGSSVLIFDANPHHRAHKLAHGITSVNQEEYHNTYNNRKTALIEHGSVVAQMVASPRLTHSSGTASTTAAKETYTGVAPDATMFAFGLNLNPGKAAAVSEQHKARYKAILEANPDVVNMSYGSNQGLSKAYVNGMYNRHANPFFYEPTAFKLAISQVKNSPLFTLAAGNNAYSNKPKYNYEKALEAALKDGNQVLDFTDPGFGLAIDNTEHNFLIFTDNVIADHTLVVTGVTHASSEAIDPNGKSSNKREYMKNVRKTIAEKLIKETTDETKKDFYRRQLALALKNADAYQHEAFANTTNLALKNELGNIFADHGAVRCGASLYNCISAPFTYVIDDERAKTGKRKVSGTSYSTPFISGVAALVKEQFPWMTAKQLKTTLLTTATDLGKKGVDPVYGWGLVNTEAALNGPRMFLYGNFVANLANERIQNGSYYFNNNIFGPAGLEVKGGTGDRLFLIGNNGYLGDTVVSSGNLYLVAGSKLGIPNSSSLASVTSKVITAKEGRFYAYNAAIYGLANKGYAELNNTKIKDDLITYRDSTLTLSVGAPIGIAGNATFYTGSKLIVLSTLSQEELNQTGYNYYLLLAANGGVKGKFANVDLTRLPTNALSNYGITYTEKGVYLANNSYSVQTAGVTLASYTGTDTAAILAGANNLNSLYETLGFDENAVTVHNGVDFTAAGVTSTSEDELVSTSQAEAGESVAKANELVNLEVKVTDTVTVPELKLTEAVSLASTEEDTDNSNSGNTNTDNGNTNTATTATEATNSNATDTTSTNPVLAKLVAGLQNATNNQLSAVFYSASLPAYSELTLLQSVQTTSRVQGFSNRILGDTATTKFNLYLDFEPQYRNISHSSTKARGKYTGNSGVIGVYGKYEDYLLGAAYFHGKSNYEQSYLGFATATGTVAGNGLSINLGKQLTAEQYLTANLYFSHDNYKLNRLIGYSTATNTVTTTSSSSTNSTSTPVFSYAKYSTNQYGIDLAWKGQLWQQANQSLSLTTRVNLNQLTQQAFREQVTEGLESLAYNLTKQKHTKLLVQVAVNYTNSFTLAEHKLQLNLGASLTYDSRYSSVTAYKVVGTNQATNKELSTANQNQALAPFLVQTQAELGYELSEKVKLGVGSKFSFAKNYRDWNANANLTLGF